MTNKFEQLEIRIRELVEVRLPGLLPGQMIREAVIRQLAETISTHTTEMDGKKFAPNVFRLATHPGDIATWQEPRLLDAFKETIQAVGRESELSFRAPPTLEIFADSGLKPGQVQISASHRDDSLEPTNHISQNEVASPGESHVPANAYVILDGRKVLPLQQAVINIGRRLENQLVIDDPRVSRTHAQLRAINGRYVIFDLNSTGGTFINGQRMSQSVLYPGDVISLAGVTLVYGQDNPPPRPDLKETGPILPTSTERTTIVLRERTDIRKKKK